MSDERVTDVPDSIAAIRGDLAAMDGRVKKLEEYLPILHSIDDNMAYITQTVRYGRWLVPVLIAIVGGLQWLGIL